MFVIVTNRYLGPLSEVKLQLLVQGFDAEGGIDVTQLTADQVASTDVTVSKFTAEQDAANQITVALPKHSMTAFRIGIEV